MYKFLLDTNISPKTRIFLEETFSFDVIDLITEKKYGFKDEEVVALAKKENRIIITFDLDFGEIYHLKENGMLGVIILRLNDQTVASVNNTLQRFFPVEAKKIDLTHSLVVIEENKIRIVRSDNS